jgi:hypothetical protein
MPVAAMDAGTLLHPVIVKPEQAIAVIKTRAAGEATADPPVLHAASGF